MFDGNGHLPAGLHNWTVDAIRQRLVDEFTTSTTRSMIMDGFSRLRTAMLGLNVQGRQLLDGSFTTSKVDPSDLDILTVVDKDMLDALDPSSQQQFAALVADKRTRATHLCDSYYLARVPTGHPDYNHYRCMWKYWLGEFGYDRADRPKGIVHSDLTSPPPAPGAQP